MAWDNDGIGTGIDDTSVGGLSAGLGDDSWNDDGGWEGFDSGSWDTSGGWGDNSWSDNYDLGFDARQGGAFDISQIGSLYENYYGPKGGAWTKLGGATLDAVMTLTGLSSLATLGLTTIEIGDILSGKKSYKDFDVLGVNSPGQQFAKAIRDEEFRRQANEILGLSSSPTNTNRLGDFSSEGEGMGLWDAIGSIGGELVGGLFGSSAAKKQSSAASSAAAASAEATKYAADLAQEQFMQQREDLMPWMETGKRALNVLAEGTLPGGTGIQNILEQAPGYQFRLAEGMKALDRTASARGNLLSGGAVKAAQRYGQDYASGEYQNVYNRLAGLAGTGQTTAQSLGDAGARYAATQGTLATNQAATEGNAAIAAANARASAYKGWGDALSTGIGEFANYLGSRS